MATGCGRWQEVRRLEKVMRHRTGLGAFASLRWREWVAFTEVQGWNPFARQDRKPFIGRNTRTPGVGQVGRVVTAREAADSGLVGEQP